MFFPKRNNKPEMRLIGLFETEEAADICIGFMGYKNPFKKKFHSGNGSILYKLYVPKEEGINK